MSHGAQDENYVAFSDRYPAAKLHILVIPKRHIEDVTKLDPDEVDNIGEHPRAKIFCAVFEM